MESEYNCPNSLLELRLVLKQNVRVREQLRFYNATKHYNKEDVKNEEIIL